MAGLAGKLWDDLRSNIVGLLLGSLFGGSLLTAIVQAFRTLQNHPFEWRFIWITFVISVLLLAVVLLIASRSKTQTQQQSLQASAGNQVNVGERAAAEINALFHRIDPRYSADFTVPIGQQANLIPAGLERDTYFLHALAVVIVNLHLEILWY